MSRSDLNDIRVHVRFKLSGLWASVMLCYIYGDFFGLYVPDKLQHIIDGRIEGVGPISQGLLITFAAIMAIPSLMIFLPLVLPAAVCRWVNIVLGLAFTLLMAASMPGMWHYFWVLGVIEMALTLTIVVLAWRWPRTAATP
jgi:hypothetical protein